jgi:hypothetical protein
MPYERIPAPAPKTTPTPPATNPPAADQQPKASGEEAPRALAVWLVAAAVCAVVFAGVIFLPDLRDAEAAGPSTRPAVPLPEKPQAKEPAEDPGVLEDMLHPAG